MDELSWWKIAIPFTKHGYSIYFKLVFLLTLLFFRPLLLEFELRLLELIVTVTVYYLFLNIFFNYVRSVLIKLYLKKHKYGVEHYDNYIVGIKRLSWFLNHLIFLLIFLQLVGINIVNVLTSLSLVAVALVLIFREYIANFINSIIIMFSKNIRLNEYVKIGEYKGRVKDISFMNIELHTETGEIVYIANNQVLTKEITNYSKKNSKKIFIDFTTPLLSSKKIEKLENKLIKKMVGNFASKKVISSLNINKVGKDFIDFSFVVETSSYNYEFESKVKDLCNKIVIDYKK